MQIPKLTIGAALTPEQYERFENFADKNGISKAELIKRAVFEYIDKNEDKRQNIK